MEKLDLPNRAPIARHHRISSEQNQALGPGLRYENTIKGYSLTRILAGQTQQICSEYSVATEAFAFYDWKVGW